MDEINGHQVSPYVETEGRGMVYECCRCGSLSATFSYPCTPAEMED